jgi:hypothetical protein
MSMIAKFARIPPDRLTEIIADPDLVTELFDESERAPSVTMQTLAEQVTNDPMKNELIRRASEILRSSIGTMEPRVSNPRI